MQRVWVGHDGGIFGGAQDDTSWASSRVETDLETLSHREDLRKYRIVLLATGGLQSFPVEGCSGQVATRNTMRVHFMHNYVLDTVVILEEVDLPHPR